MSTDSAHIADWLIEGKPQAHAMRFDGSMVVINVRGQKFVFSPEEVQTAREEINLLAEELTELPRKAPKKPPKPPSKAPAPKKTR